MNTSGWMKIFLGAAIFLIMLGGKPPQTGIHFDERLTQPLPQTGLASAPEKVTTNSIEFGGIQGFAYNPNLIFISPGETVEWKGDFSSHPLVSDENLWTTVNGGNSFTFTFNQAGIYHYHCFFHGAAGLVGMSGTIAVGKELFLPAVISMTFQ